MEKYYCLIDRQDYERGFLKARSYPYYILDVEKLKDVSDIDEAIAIAEVKRGLINAMGEEKFNMIFGKDFEKNIKENQFEQYHLITIETLHKKIFTSSEISHMKFMGLADVEGSPCVSIEAERRCL